MILTEEGGIFEVVGQKIVRGVYHFTELDWFGAHGLNNTVWDAISGVKFSDQLDQSSSKYCCPVGNFQYSR